MSPKSTHTQTLIKHLHYLFFGSYFVKRFITSQHVSERTLWSGYIVRLPE